MKYVVFTLFVLILNSAKPQYSGIWNPVSDMLTSRNGHTATSFFTSGPMVLVTGGYDGIGNLKSAEVYDVGTDTWTAVGDMDSIRFEHSATALNDGRVLITGGWDGGFLNYKGTQIYNPDSAKFFDGPDMTVGRSGHTATLLQDGKVLITGGYSNEHGNTDICDLFDPITNTITQTGSLHYGRSYHTATLLPDGRVLAAGGYNPDFGFQLKSCELFDPASGTWSDAADMHVPRDYFGAAYAPESFNVVVAGGRYFNGSGYEGLNSAESYSYLLDSWENISNIPEKQSYNKLIYYVGAEGTRYYMLPGSTNQSSGSITFTHTYSLLGDWNAEPMFNDGRYYYAMTSNPMIVCGGNELTGTSVEIFYPDFGAVTDHYVDNAIKIYPVPAHDFIRVHSENLPVTGLIFFDISGKKIKELDHLENTDMNYISISDLPAGFYTLQVLHPDHKMSRGKFIKD